jgi:putative chitinase
MLTTEQLRAIMPKLPAAKEATLFPFLTSAITEFAIEPPARTAAFLAQLAHESAQFRFMEEIWGPTAAQKRYEPPGKLATNLGNTEPGDGLRFKGRGPIQITGRANYRRFGDLLGVDLVADPARAALPEVAFRIAGLFWSKKGLNELADRVTAETFKEITRRINGGFNGLADRERFYETAKTVLGVTAAAAPVARGGPGFQAGGAEPLFERGYEAIRSSVVRRVRRKKGAKKRTAKKRTAKQARATSAKTSRVVKKSSRKKAGAKRSATKKSVASKRR